MVERIPMSLAGNRQLREELERLERAERPEIVKAIEVARAHGDLSENAEYHAAREKMSYVKGMIEEYDSRISMAEIIDVSALKGQTKIMFGAQVTLMEIETEKKISYQIVGEHESEIEKGKISIKSPIGKALIGKKLNDEVAVKTPGGVKEFEVIHVEYV